MTERININKDNLIWAIERAGFDVDEFLEKNPLVESWIDATKQPTLKQLEKFAHQVRVPFGYLFLQEHPKEEIPIAFFRTKKGHKPFNLNVYDTIMMLQRRQDWVSEQKEEEGCDRLDFVGKYTIHSSLREVVNDVRGLLHYSPDWAFDKKDQALCVICMHRLSLSIILTVIPHRSLLCSTNLPICCLVRVPAMAMWSLQTMRQRSFVMLLPVMY